MPSDILCYYRHAMHEGSHNLIIHSIQSIEVDVGHGFMPHETRCLAKPGETLRLILAKANKNSFFFA